MTLQSNILTRADGATIAYDKIEGRIPGIVFLHGLASDRGGTKAQALEDHCKRHGRSFISFDMYGHGESSGRFEDGCISRWTEDAVTVLDELAQGPQVLVGSSMGGWVMLRCALARPNRIAGLVGIAAAPDFTEDLMWASFSDEQKMALKDYGVIEQPSDYNDSPYRISLRLIEDGRQCLVLRDKIDLRIPVRLIQGQKDEDVPFETAHRIADAITSEDVKVTIVPDGDHRLSRDEDLLRLTAIVDELCSHIEDG